MTYAKSARHFAIAAIFFAGTALLAQDAILKVHADPRDAFVFVDGQAYKQHNGTLEIAPGEHTIGVYSYGFIPFMKKVALKAGENPDVTVALQRQTGEVSGPWGNLEVRGVKGDYVVFLNGRSPEFYIGRVDEIRGNRVVLPPGQQHVYVVNPEGNQDVNTWYVDVIANRKAIFHSDRNQTTYEKWAYGENLHALPLYQPDTQIIALGPVGVNLVAFPAQAPCGQPVRLAWNAINGYETLLKLNGVAVAKSGTNGEQMLNLKQTTTYFLETFGPGGVSMTPLTIQVDRSVKTSLTATPAVVRYHKVGDNVLDPGSTTLDWSASNATSVRLDPIGPVTGTSGVESVTLSPKNDGYGHVEETRVFKITATNDCGGSDTTTATVEVAGSIDPPVPPAAEPLPPILPQTGSPLPLIGLLGLGSLTCSLLLRKRRG